MTRLEKTSYNREILEEREKSDKEMFESVMLKRGDKVIGQEVGGNGRIEGLYIRRCIGGIDNPTHMIQDKDGKKAFIIQPQKL